MQGICVGNSIWTAWKGVKKEWKCDAIEEIRRGCGMVNDLSLLASFISLAYYPLSIYIAESLIAFRLWQIFIDVLERGRFAEIGTKREPFIWDIFQPFIPSFLSRNHQVNS